MRKDISKVVTERERAGGGVKAPKGEKRNFQRIPLEEQPKSEKIRAKWDRSNCEKNFTDVLGPLYGYLLGKVGQPWDKVYSEICQHLKNTSLQQKHIRGHIDDFVETKVIMVNGVPYHGEGNYSYGDPIDAWSRREFQMYVNPETGLLCKVKKQGRKHKKDEPPFKRIDDTHVLKQLKGIWYLITLKPILPESLYSIEKRPLYNSPNTYYNAKQFRHFHDNVLDMKITKEYDLHLQYGGCFKAVSKKQLNKKEIRKHGLQ